MTPMVEGSLKQMDPDNWEEVGKQFVEPNPMKRFGKPEEVGYLVAFYFPIKQTLSMQPLFRLMADNLINIKSILYCHLS